MILILLFSSDFWLDIVNLKNSKYLKKDKLRMQRQKRGILKDGGVFACQKTRKKK